MWCELCFSVCSGSVKYDHSGPDRPLGSPLVQNGCDSLSTKRKGARPEALKLIWDGNFHANGLAGQVTQLYTQHLYALINAVFFLNCWVTLSEEARGELLFWQQLSRLRFESDIWPSFKSVSIRIATDANDFAWGGNTMSCPLELARDYLSGWETVQSSTYQELLGVSRCLQAMVHMCESRFVVLQVDAQNLLEIVNRGAPN